MQIEKMLQRLQSVHMESCTEFKNFVLELKMEFDVKSLNAECVHVFTESVPEQLEANELRECVEELSLDLHRSLSTLQEEISTMEPLKRSEILHIGLNHMQQAEEKEKLAVVDEAAGEEAEQEEKAAIQKRIGLLQGWTAYDTAAMVRAARLEEKTVSTPKRRRSSTESMPSPFSAFSGRSVSEVQANGAELCSMIGEGATFAEIIQKMEQKVNVVCKIGKVARQVREGSSPASARPYTFIKVEVYQPGAKARMFLIAWGQDFASRMQSQLLDLENCVVRLNIGKYDYSKKFDEHQIKLQEQTTLLKIDDPQMLAAFEHLVETEMSLKSVGDCTHLQRINVKAYVRACDATPNGPAKNGGYWRSFELSDAAGVVVKGMAWGPVATTSWVESVTVEMFNVSVRKTDERIQLDESSIVVFKDSYDLSLTMPVYFTPLIWNHA